MNATPNDDAATDEARTYLFDRLASLAIAAPTVPYPAHETVEEGKRLRGEMAGTFTKNLLLRDKRGSCSYSRSMRTARLTSRRYTNSSARTAVSVSHQPNA